MVFVQLRYLFGNLKCVAQFDCNYLLIWGTALVGQFADLQFPGLFRSAEAENLEIGPQDEQGLVAPVWPYDLIFEGRRNTPP